MTRHLLEYSIDFAFSLKLPRSLGILICLKKTAVKKYIDVSAEAILSFLNFPLDLAHFVNWACELLVNVWWISHQEFNVHILVNCSFYLSSASNHIYTHLCVSICEVDCLMRIIDEKYVLWCADLSSASGTTIFLVQDRYSTPDPVQRFIVGE